MNAPHNQPTEQEDEVSQALRLLRTTPTAFTSEDSHLLADMTRQFFEYCSNFFYGGQDCEEDFLLAKSLDYLQRMDCTYSENQYATPTPQHEYNNNRTVEVRWINGRKFYFMDDKPIRFKVLKNKPKNGDFRVRWNRNYLQLKEFKEHYGHVQVTRGTSGYEDLGNWVAEQRRKLKNGKITLEQFEILSELGKIQSNWC